MSGKPGAERNEVQRSEDLQRMARAAGNAQRIDTWTISLRWN
jgi:hypothetical protein